MMMLMMMLVSGGSSSSSSSSLLGSQVDVGFVQLASEQSVKQARLLKIRWTAVVAERQLITLYTQS